MSNIIKNIILSFFIFYSYCAYTYDKEDAKALLALTQGIPAHEAIKLEGGLSGAQLFIVQTKNINEQGQQYFINYVVRYLENESEDAIKNEIAAAQNASENGYGPFVCFASVKDAVIIMNMLPNDFQEESDDNHKCYKEFAKPRKDGLSKEELERLDFIEYKRLAKLSLLLQKIHNSKSKSTSKVADKTRIIDQIINNIKLIDSIDKEIADKVDLSRINTEVDKISAALAKHTIIKPCHNDLKRDNIIWTTKFPITDSDLEFEQFLIPMAIDYEKAAQDDPYFDIATVAMYFCHNLGFEEFLLRSYLGKNLMLKADNKESVYALLKDNPNAAYAIADNVIYTIENKTLKPLEIRDGIKNFTEKLKADNSGRIYLTAEQESTITGHAPIKDEAFKIAKARLYLMKQLVLLRYGLCNLRKACINDLYIMSYDPTDEDVQALLKKNNKIKYIVNKDNNTIYAINANEATYKAERLEEKENSSKNWLSLIIQTEKKNLNSTIRLSAKDKKTIITNTNCKEELNSCALDRATGLIKQALNNFSSQKEYTDALNLLNNTDTASAAAQ